MSAELYVEGPDDHYFENYGGFGLLSQLELSWCEDVLPLVDDHQLLQPNGAAELVRLIESAGLTYDGFQWYDSDFREAQASWRLIIEKHPDDPVAQDLARASNAGALDFDGWRQHYEQRRHVLLAFLRRAIAENKPIYCDL